MKVKTYRKREGVFHVLGMKGDESEKRTPQTMNILDITFC